MVGLAKKFYDYLDDPMGYQQDPLKTMCPEEKDALMMCILQSECFRSHGNFDYCLKDGISEDCKLYRSLFFKCSQSLTGMGGILKKELNEDA